jgi:hypothetical protein
MTTLSRSGCAAAFGVIVFWAGCVSGPRKPVPPAAPAVDVESAIFLVGDAGAPADPTEPVLEALQAELSATAVPATVLFLGDNIYPAGMPLPGSPDRGEGERRVRAQAEAALQGGAGDIIFIPGNHDWNYAGAGGWERVLQQEAYVESIGARIRFLPDGGCPGPMVVDVGSRLRIILIDTEWWLRNDDRPLGALFPCLVRTQPAFVDSLRVLIAGAGERRVMIAGHHPMVTGGTHGGHFSARQHVFPLTDVKPWLWLPLPVLGSLYPIARQLGISDQDVSGGRYKRMREGLRSAFADHPPLLFAAGHEHSLQVLRGDGTQYQIVTGTGIYGHTSNVLWTDRTLFTAPERSGYVRLDVQRNGHVRLAVVVVDGRGQRTEPFSLLLE